MDLLENSGSKAKKKNGTIAVLRSHRRQRQARRNRDAGIASGGYRSSRPSDRPPHRRLPPAPGRRSLAVAGQKQVSLYNTDDGALLGVIPFPEGIAQVLRFSNDGAYLLVGGGTHASKGVASLYDVKTGDRLLTVGDELGHRLWRRHQRHLSNVALGGPKRIVRVFDTASGEVRFELKKHTDWVYAVAYSPDGVLLASGDRSGGLHVWEAETGRLYLDLPGHTGAIRGLSWRTDSNVLVSASEDGTVKLWEMNEGKQLTSFAAHGGGATGVMMAKDGRIVSCGKDKTVKLWNADGSGHRDHASL